MDATLLSRWQFAITTTYHFLFVPLTLGLTVFIALLETSCLMTKDATWKKVGIQLTKFFGTLFLINFALGVVTGIIQEFHFGMNWSEYSRFMGDIFGAPLALEALTAFFLESTFFGVWVFGWEKLSPKVHCIVGWLVAFGSNLSAFWILVANSFMQNPVGYAIRGGRAEMTDFFALITNPYVWGEMSHTFFSSVATAGFLAVLVCAWKIVSDHASRAAFLRGMKWATLYLIIGLVATMGSGHLHAQYLAKAQPMKLSSMEALWETADPAPFAIVADVDAEKGKNHSEIAVPGAFSFMLYNTPSGAVPGIHDLQSEAEKMYGPGNYIPDVLGLFWSFRIMLGVGGLMMLIALFFGAVAWLRPALAEQCPAVFRLLPLTLPLPFIANSVGWYIVEAGRQPWIVVGLQRTADAVSPNLTPGEVWLTMIGFTALYLVLAVAAFYVACRVVRRTTIRVEEGDEI